MEKPEKKNIFARLLGMITLSRLIRWGIFALLVWWVHQNWAEDRPPAALQERFAFPDSKFIMLDSMQVHYRICGKGEPIILLHDAASSLHTWTVWTEKLSDKYQVISVDLPGFGLTGAHPLGSYSLFMYAGFLEKFADSLHIKAFHLAGNGLGAQIAWFYAAEHPAQLKKLILINAPGFEDKHIDWVGAVARTPFANRLLWRITPRSFIKENLHDIYANDAAVTDSLITRHYELFLRQGSRKAFTDRAKVENNRPPIEFIEKINLPTLILWGAEDTRNSPENAYQFHKKIRRADLRIYEDTGHWVQEETPELSAEDVRAFLEGRF